MSTHVRTAITMPDSLISVPGTIEDVVATADSDPMGHLRKEPGYLGYATGASFIVAIHTDWPAYPSPPGRFPALFDICQFPRGTRFCCLDEIDRCMLLVAEQYISKRGAWDEWSYKIALWVDDLLDLQAHGLITGVVPLTEREWEKRRRDEWRAELRAETESGQDAAFDPIDHLYTELPDGTWKKLQLPPLPEEDEDDWLPCFVRIDGSLSATELGWQELSRAMTAELKLPPAMERVAALLNLGFHDAAVREASVMLETALRDRLRADSNLFGQSLVRRFLAVLGEDVTNAEGKLIGTQLRTTFQFIRNHVAHNQLDLPRDETLALLFRVGWLVDQVANVPLCRGGSGTGNRKTG